MTGPERPARDDDRSRWNARHATRDDVVTPARFLTEQAGLLPPRGRALDVAGGTGRNAVWLAERGFEVVLVDVSDVALERAERRAADAGVSLQLRRLDLSTVDVPHGPFEVIVVHHFLDRDVWAALPPRLAPGGVLLVCQATVRNLERHPRPSRPWLLAEGELGHLADTWTAADPEVEVLERGEGWFEDRHEARAVLRRRP